MGSGFHSWGQSVALTHKLCYRRENEEVLEPGGASAAPGLK